MSTASPMEPQKTILDTAAQFAPWKLTLSLSYKHLLHRVGAKHFKDSKSGLPCQSITVKHTQLVFSECLKRVEDTIHK